MDQPVKFGPLQMENGYIATVERGEVFRNEPAAQFFWSQSADDYKDTVTEPYRHLFLASPDLYNALAELETWWGNWMPDDAGTQGGYTALEKARAALAKARGEGTEA